MIHIETTREAAECMEPRFGARELRDLAANAGVSRERGDTKMQTAVKIVEQDPALAAAAVENDPEVDMEASAFREAREVGGGPISLDEAKRRARHRGMSRKLRSLERATAGLTMYEVEVDWEYGGSVDDGSSSVNSKCGYEPGLTSVYIRPDDDSDMSALVEGRAHMILTPHGRCTMLEAGGKEYISSRNEPEPGRRWRVAMEMIECFYDP